MRHLERRLRLAAFFSGLAALTVYYALRLAPLRLLRHLARPLTRRLARGIQRGWARKVVFLARIACRTRVLVEGRPPEARGVFIVVSNHQSILDIPVILSALPRQVPAFVTKESLRVGIPNISPAGRLAEYAFISRRKGDARQIEELRAFGARLERDGVTAAIFPEGSRSRDGRLGADWKAGGLGVLLEAMPRARVLPVALDGTFRAATWASLLTDFPGLEIRVRIGEPIELAAADRADAAKVREVVARCRAFAEAALGEWRGQAAAAAGATAEAAARP
jgi:1-acyl-sn-glycerol-3-phosphate acyltransferase